MRSTILCLIVSAMLPCAACDKSPDQRQREQAELDAKVAEKLHSEKMAEVRTRADEERASQARAAIREEDIRREATETFSKFDRERPWTQDLHDATTQEAAAGRVRALMSDPMSMEVRTSSMNSQKTAVCMEINYKEAGTYVGVRQALITPDTVLVEPDKNNVAHRVFEVSAKNLGCDVALAATKGK
ncbi:MAG: hypothetical protein E6H66_08765 [Betaproteobacteria bacterium]|nr:MAG: hypothetical protein E6H66_08765 [Betaproteobacteria bacterium]